MVVSLICQGWDSSDAIPFECLKQSITCCIMLKLKKESIKKS